MIERSTHHNVRIDSQTEHTATVPVLKCCFSVDFSIFFRWTVEQIFFVILAVELFAPDLNVAVVKAAQKNL